MSLWILFSSLLSGLILPFDEEGFAHLFDALLALVFLGSGLQEVACGSDDAWNGYYEHPRVRSA